MEQTQFESAGAEWLQTELTNDGGVRLTGSYPTIDVGGSFLGGMSILAGIVIGGFGYNDGNDNLFWLGVALFAAPTLAYGVKEMIGKKKLDIKIYEDRIGVKDGKRYKFYSRDLPLEFRIERHQKAISEELLERKTRHLKKRVYRDAIEVVLQYGEKRIALAEMPEEKGEMGRELCLRIQNVCHSLDAAMQMASQGNPARKAPVGDFGPAPDIR